MKTRIVVIEDHMDMRENIAEILELSDYEVFSAENGKTGLEVIKNNPPDLILCDIMMPELDGYGVLKIMRSHAETATIPFIFLTAKTEKAEMRLGMNLGADDYLTKPFESIDLLNAVETRLERNRIAKTQYSKDLEGLNTFISDARGQSELVQLSQNREVIRCSKKEMLFRKNQFPRFLYYIISGKLKLTAANEDGKEYIIDILTKGSFVGYQALLQDSPYKESAQILEEAELALIPKDDFFELLFSNSDVSSRFIKMLSNDYLEAEQKLIELAYNSVRQRVAKSILFVDEKYNTEQVYPFSFSVLREDLANIVGTAKESVIRTLSDFKQSGVIQIKDGTISIIEKKKLEQISN